MIKESQSALSTSFIASVVGVSRQVIVGDIALLRAEGHQIIATARGYIAERVVNNNKYVRKIACQHKSGQTEDELYLLVDLGVRVEDVVIEHEVYGELTQGVHLHTVSCRSKEHFDKVMIAMEKAVFLVNGK